MKYDGVCVSRGTGFVYSSDDSHFLITNRHNVTGRHNITNEQLCRNSPTPNELVIWHHHNKGLGCWITKTEPIVDNTDRPIWFEHPTFGSKVDFVAVRLTKLDDVKLYSYNRYDDEPKLAIGPADIVSVIGFPFGIAVDEVCAIWATGFIASEPSVDLNGLPLIMIDCRGRPGQSGSPVVAFRSGGSVAMENGTSAMLIGPVTNVLGIYSGRVNEQSDLGYVWKMNAVRELVASINLVQNA